MTEWRWVAQDVVFAVHDRQIAEHGGGPGVRDKGLIESALAKPQNIAAYGDPDIAELVASYAFGLAKNHGFVDGNKRIAWITARLFLIDNGNRLVFDKIEAVRLMEDVASGAVNEIALAEWFRQRLQT